MLILDSYKSYLIIDFNYIYIENNIILIYILFYSLYLL
jgi:hypothetical protein